MLRKSAGKPSGEFREVWTSEDLDLSEIQVRFLDQERLDPRPGKMCLMLKNSVNDLRMRTLGVRVDRDVGEK